MSIITPTTIQPAVINVGATAWGPTHTDPCRIDTYALTAHSRVAKTITDGIIANPIAFPLSTLHEDVKFLQHMRRFSEGAFGLTRKSEGDAVAFTGPYREPGQIDDGRTITVQKNTSDYSITLRDSNGKPQITENGYCVEGINWLAHTVLDFGHIRIAVKPGYETNFTIQYANNTTLQQGAEIFLQLFDMASPGGNRMGTDTLVRTINLGLDHMHDSKPGENVNLQDLLYQKFRELAESEITRVGEDTVITLNVPAYDQNGLWDTPAVVKITKKPDGTYNIEITFTLTDTMPATIPTKEMANMVLRQLFSSRLSK